MHAFAVKRIEIACRDTCEGFSFTCLQFQDLAFVQDYGTHDLDVVVALAQDAERCLPYKCVGFRQNLVQGLAVGQAFLETLCLKREVLVLEALGPALI